MKTLRLMQFFAIITVFSYLIGCSKADTTTSINDKKNEIIVTNDTMSDEVSDFQVKTEDFSDEATEDNKINSDNSAKRVLCFGDSLTEGYGGEGITMCNTLQEISGATVFNYGVFSESLSCMAARQGGNPQYLCEDIVIPADCTPVHAQVQGKYGWEMLLVFGDAGINNVSLGGIEGTYTIDDEGTRYFTRLTEGEEVALPQGTQLFTHAMLDKKDDDILVIWGGSNDEPQSSEEIPPMLEKIDEMIAYHGNDYYVVISLTSRHGRIPVVDEVNKMLAEKYGDHYFDLRSYYLNDALNDLGIRPTDEDLIVIEKGDVPFSIRKNPEEDENHGNPDFYRLAGEQLYKKLVELGYLN